MDRDEIAGREKRSAERPGTGGRGDDRRVGGGITKARPAVPAEAREFVNRDDEDVPRETPGTSNDKKDEEGI